MQLQRMPMPKAADCTLQKMSTSVQPVAAWNGLCALLHPLFDLH